jgi:hypothetical protein
MNHAPVIRVASPSIIQEQLISTSPIVRYQAPPHPPTPKVTRDTPPPPRRLVPTRMPQAIVYVSLALAIYITVRGDTAQIALILPYLAGVLQLVFKARPIV